MSVLDYYPCNVRMRLCRSFVLDKASFEVFEVAACARSSMDRASDFGSEGWGFKSLRAHHRIKRLHLLSPFSLLTGHNCGETSSIHSLTKVSWCQVGIPKGCLYNAVTENLLHGHQVNSCHDS